MKQKCAILMVRVSTHIQDYQAQIDDLTSFAKNKGYNKFHIIETKETGLADLDKKVGANELFTFIKANPNYNVVFATEISRLGRRQSILHSLKEWFIKHKIQFHAKDTGYSLFESDGKVSASGEIMFTLYGYFAESEMKQKIDRFRRNRKRLMELGLSISGKTLFGYKRVKKEGEKSTLIIDEENAGIIRTLFDWYKNGINGDKKSTSIKKITLECIKRGYPVYTHSKRNINKLLKEEGYVGEKITNNKYKNPKYDVASNEEKYIVSNNRIKYPVIISKELYDSVQKRLLENNTTAEKSTKHVTLLSHILKCPICNRDMNGNYRIYRGREANSYRCTSRASVKPCGNTQSIGMQMVDSAVWCLIKSDRELLKKVIDYYEPDKIIESLDTAELRFNENIKAIDDEIIQLEAELNSLSKTKNISLVNFLKPITQRVKALGKKRSIYSEELAKIKIERTNYNYDYNEITKLFNQSIKKIEKSKVLLKQYINTFVDEINLIVHTNKFSVLRIKFKKASKDRNKYIHQFAANSPGFFNEMYLLIDKSHTLDIKTYKTDVPISFIDSTIFFRKKSKIREAIDVNDLETLKENNIWVEYEFQKNQA
jgi:DNA invertase Pin-like site-specific DNA recombinase